MSRPTWDQTFMSIAESMATMGTCARRQVGCVITSRERVVLSTGFNGPPPKWPHCRSFGPEEPGFPCPGAMAESGTHLDECYSNHAEVNSLIKCPDVSLAHTCYTTSSPCVSCTKALLCTNIIRIVFLESYPHPEAMKLWTRYGAMLRQNVWEHRSWEQLRADGSTNLISVSTKNLRLD